MVMGPFDDLPGYERQVILGERPVGLVWGRYGKARLPTKVTGESDLKMRRICTPGLGHAQFMSIREWSGDVKSASTDDRVLAIGQKAVEAGLLLDFKAFEMVKAGEVDELERQIDAAIAAVD